MPLRLNNFQNSKQSQFLTVICSCLIIIQLQQYIKLSTLWVITSIMTGIISSICLKYHQKIHIKPYIIYFIPIILLGIFNAIERSWNFNLNIQMLLFIFLGLNIGSKTKKSDQ